MYNTEINDTLTLINIKIIVQNYCEVVCFHGNAMIRLLSDGSTFAKLNYNINNCNIKSANITTHLSRLSTLTY